MRSAKYSFGLGTSGEEEKEEAEKKETKNGG